MPDSNLRNLRNLRIDARKLRNRIKDFKGVAEKEHENMSRWRKFSAWVSSASFNLFGPKRSEHASDYIRLVSGRLRELANHLDDLAEMKAKGADSTVKGYFAMLRRVEKVTLLLSEDATCLEGVHSSRNGRDYEAYHEVLNKLLINLRSTVEDVNGYLTNIRLPEASMVDGKLHADHRASHAICLIRLRCARGKLEPVTKRLNSLGNFVSAESGASSQQGFRGLATSLSGLPDSGRAPQRSRVSSDRPRQPAAQPTRQSSAQQQRPDQPRPATRRPSNKQSTGCCGCFSAFFSAVRDAFSPRTPSRAQPARQQRVDTASGYPDLRPRYR